MMHFDYVTSDGSVIASDLDAVIAVLRSPQSGVRRAWTAMIVFVPATGAFVELRSSPPNVRGDSQSEAEEVSTSYLQDTFGLTSAQQSAIKANPGAWRMVDLCA
jgi:hypothetical protein